MAKMKGYKWGPKGMLVGDEYSDEKDLAVFGGPKSDFVKSLHHWKWSAKGMVKGGKYVLNADVQDKMNSRPSPAPNPEPVPVPPGPTPVTPPPPPKAIVPLRIQSTGDKMQTNVPFTVGHVFSPGDLQAGKALVGMLDDGTTIPLQFDLKVAHPDGSAKHGLVSGILPRVEPGKEIVLGLAPVEPKDDGKNVSKLMVLAKVEMTVDGVTYTADNSESKERRWMFGRIVTELHASQPLRDSKGNAHPHLHARFATRCYDSERTRLDVIVANEWAYEPGPRNFTYDLRITVGDKVVHEQKGLTHYHHAHSRYLFWHGEEPQINVIHDLAYADSTKAVPHYDPSIVVPEKTLAGWQKEWEKAGKGPMQVGLPQKAMGGQGGRPEIAIVPAWAVLWLLTGDKRMRDMTLGTADSAGSWSAHYRDRNTDQPVSLVDYPYMTIYGRSTDTKNPATKKYEAFPALDKKTSGTPFSHDSAHQPGFSFVPYLLTGDHYHLEELQFWAMWNVFQTNPGYRKNVQGLLWRQQVRGIAWSLRTLAQAAWITPDNDRLKKHFEQVMESNFAPSVNPLQWVNAFGAYVGPGAVIYQSDTAIAPFQDDHLTSVLGYVVDLGFDCAQPMLEAKAKFPIQRLIGTGTNWRAAANYTWPIRDADGHAFEAIGESYKALYSRLEKSADPDDKYSKQRLDSEGLDLSGYPTSTEGFPANMQMAISVAARYSPEAWEKFMQRQPKPNYGTGPQFAGWPR